MRPVRYPYPIDCSAQRYPTISMVAAGRSRVFLVDDHRIVRLGFRRLLEQSDTLSVAGEADSGEKALEEISQVRPNLAIVDIAMQGMDGIELTRTLKEKYPEVRVLIVSMHNESFYVDRALAAGADGYVLKDNVDELMLEAAGAVLAGRRYLCRDVADSNRRGA